MFSRVCLLGALVGGLVVAVKLTPVPKVDSSKYIGRWYQMYSDAFVENSFEYNSYCDTADYAINPNGTISVLNRDRAGSVSGVESSISGYAVQDNTTQGILTVHLDGVPLGAPYWIFNLGPETYGTNGQYQYAVVSDPLQLSLFVLARNVTDFYANYDLSVRNWLNSSGYTNAFNRPVATVQLGCKYWD